MIDEIIDVQTGTIYYRRAGKDIEMMADVKKWPAPALIHLKARAEICAVQWRQDTDVPAQADQVTIYVPGKNNADFESYLVLGFGGSGQDLLKVVRRDLSGRTSSGVNAAKLQLVPKSEKVRNTYNKILLWIDPDKGISVQQQFFTPQGDYRLAKYSRHSGQRKKDSRTMFSS